MPRVAAFPAMRSRDFWRTIAGEMRLLFGRPPRMQFGALCYRLKKKGGHEILLITSRDTGRWVTPKGWPMAGRSASEVAAREAFEEAGVRGRVSEKPIGRFAYPKTMRGGLKVRCIVQLHALEYSGSEKNFREKGQREIAWFPPEEAASRVQEPGLKAIIRSFRP
ncbi:MAG: NUDIX hydrolase [Pararhizobium sp.]